MLLLAIVSECTKYVQGTNAQKANTGYGTSPKSTFSQWLKNTVNTTIVITGWMITQVMPARVCL